jgi:hypothetical protein
MRVVVFAPDLADRSRIEAALAATGDVQIVRRADELVSAARGADVVVVDLERSPDVLPDVVAAAGRVVGFGPHVDVDLLRGAEAAGVQALPRSQFFADIPSAVTTG